MKSYQKKYFSIMIIGLLFVGLASLAHGAETSHNSHWSKDLRVGANMDLSAEVRDYGPAVERQLLDLREVELSLEAQIKPWLYGMIFLSRPSDEEMSVEEAAVIADLSDTLRLKAGLYRNEFGLINTIHEPERPQVSLPLPVVEFLGEEQLRERSVTLGQLFEWRGGYRAAISGAVMNSDNDVALDKGASGRKAFSAKLYLGRQGEDMAFQLGLSTLTGKNNEAGRSTHLQVLDFRLLWQPSYAAALDYPARFSWIGEVFSNQRQLDAVSSNKARGGWTLADYQFKPAHHVGVGAEYAQGRLDSSVISRAWSAHYSWYYTAHGRVQLQARYLDVDGGDNGTQVLLQWNVVLGPHSERPFMAVLPLDVKM